MNKFRIFIEIRKVEIWKFLKDLKFMSRCIAYVLLWIAIFFTIVITWAMTTNAYKLLNLFNKDILYLEVWGNLIYIPLKFCLSFWIISIISKHSMRLVASKMNEDEMEEVGIKSSLHIRRKAIYKGLRSQEDILKTNAKNIMNIQIQLTMLNSWLKTLRINPYIDTSTKLKICYNIKEIWYSAEICKSYFEEQEKSEGNCDGNN